MPAKRKLFPRFRRFCQWLKQVVLLGRTDWRKASDDATPPHLSRSEREELRPHFDVSAIKPRAMTPADRVNDSAPAATRPARAPDSTPSEVSPEPAPRPPKSRVFRRHRHERTNHIAVNPLSAFTSDKLPASRLERLYEKFFGRRG